MNNDEILTLIQHENVHLRFKSFFFLHINETFLSLLNEPGLGTGIDPGMALTPFLSWTVWDKIRTHNLLDRESTSSLPTRPVFRHKWNFFFSVFFFCVGLSGNGPAKGLQPLMCFMQKVNPWSQPFLLYRSSKRLQSLLTSNIFPFFLCRLSSE